MIDFIGIGAGKSGSTWLYNNIISHPDVYDGNPKEIQFFNKHYDKGIEWYNSYFSDSGDKVCGEFSVQYLLCPECPQKIKKHFPDAKLIVILRDPVKRMYSDYLHSIRKNDISQGTEYKEFIKDKKKLMSGVYYEYLKRYYDYYDPKKIKVLILEDVVADQERYIKEVYQYIGLKNVAYVPEDLSVKINKSVEYKYLFLENIVTNVSRFMNNAGMGLMVERLKRIGVPDLIRKYNKVKDLEYCVRSEDEAFLIDYYSKCNEQLFDLISYRVDNWK